MQVEWFWTLHSLAILIAKAIGNNDLNGSIWS